MSSAKRWYKQSKDTLMDIPSCSNSLSKNWMLYQNLLSQEFKLYRSIFIDQREDLTYNFLFQTFFFYVYCLFMRCILIKQHILRFSILGHFLLQVNVASSVAAMYLYNIYTEHTVNFSANLWISIFNDIALTLEYIILSSLGRNTSENFYQRGL